jgi:hypothetical protein
MANRDTPMQWEDYSTSERKSVASEINRIGKSTKTNAAESVSKLRTTESKESNKQTNREKAGKKANVIESIAGTFKDKPITLQGAANRRGAAFSRAIDYARNENTTLPGAGWYIDHSDSIQQSRGDIPFRNAAAAAAAFSPGKDPKVDELPAFAELAKLHNEDHSVTVDNTSNKVRDLSSQTLARFATQAAAENSANAERTVVSSSETFHVAGRPHERMTVKGIDAMRGVTSPETTNDPMTAPKTSSYFHSIADAGEASLEEKIDYESIARHLVTGDPKQGMLMFSAKEPGAPAKNSILSPDHATAEDTWMQAISSGQALSAKQNGRNFSPAKRAVDKGGPGDMASFQKRNTDLPKVAEITSVGAVHAFNNKATRMAASDVGPVSFDQFGQHIQVPSVMMQEVAWTQARREAGGDAPFNASQRQKAKADKAAASERRSNESGIQDSLFD